MSQNLFVGNLAFATRDDELREFFAQIGEVTGARVITERDSGRSKGFGFVEFADEANNQKAIDELNGKELDGRPINISIAAPKGEGGGDRPRRDFNRGGGHGGGNRGGYGGNRGGGGRNFRDTGNSIRGF
ncbi:RNA-binding protein [Candidatus Saccharibacteria bacterium]|nr:RNA-binding protein [Candidatus Saccharibacteria bacterium]